MRYYKEINGNKVFFSGILEVGDKQIINPTREQIIANGWEEYIPPVSEPYIPTYEERVEQLIRERYSLSAELAIQRQRETKAEEFNEYFAYCEECKIKAKNLNEEDYGRD
jgi:hypothetical protein